MSRKGLNIYKRKDGRWEARYIKSRTAQGKPLYGYLYASSYHEARNRLQDVIRLQGNAPNSKEMSKGSVFEFFSIEWLDTFSTSFKESTYIRYRTLIRCYLMPYFQTAKIESITKEHVLDFCKEIIFGVYGTFSFLLTSHVAAALVAIVLLICKKASRKDGLPFGPFFYLGYLATLLMGTF